MNLSKKLGQWTEEGLITKEQSERITAHEESDQGNRAHHTLLFLGVAIVAIGVVSLIAANWEEIPPGLKLVADFLLLIGIGGSLVYLKERKKGIWFEAILAFFVLLVLASIGLIAQIYHTGGKLHEALFLWLLIVFPATLFSRARFLPHLIAAGFVLAVSSYVLEWRWWMGPEEGSAYVRFSSLPLIVGMIGNLFFRFKSLSNFSASFYVWTVLTFLAGTVVGNLQVTMAAYHLSYGTMISYTHYDTLLFCLLFVLTLYFLKNWKAKQKHLAAFIGLFYVLMFFSVRLNVESKLTAKMLGASLLLLLWGALALFFVWSERPKLFQSMIVLIGLRFLVIYFEVFGSLAMTGVGLIVSGLMILAATTLWVKHHKSLYKMVEGWVQ